MEIFISMVMIKTKTWISNKLLQNKFDRARAIIAASDHPLAVNYSTWFDNSEVVAYSMSYDKDDIYLCSTIGRKEYWPTGVYRIINRVFKPQPKNIVTKNIEHFWADMVLQQIEFCQSLEDFECAIVTRKQGYTRTLTQLANTVAERGIEFKLYKNAIWVCDDFNNPDCQQNLIYFGNSRKII
jgi:hypothetical protein